MNRHGFENLVFTGFVKRESPMLGPSFLRECNPSHCDHHIRFFETLQELREGLTMHCQPLCGNRRIVSTVAIGDIGRKFKEAREAMRPIPNQTQFARMLGVTQARLSNWERGQHDPPAEAITRASEVTRQPLAFFYGDDLLGVSNRQTSVYNSPKATDNLPEPSLVEAAIAIADPRTISAVAMVGDGSRIWSVKGAKRQPLNVFAFLSQGRDLVQLTGDSLSKRFHPGTVLVFHPDPYPRLDTFLLVESKINSDLRSIRYIDPEHPSRLVGIENAEAAEPLSEWNVLGYAWAEIRGSQGSVPHVDIRPDGIGPRRR